MSKKHHSKQNRQGFDYGHGQPAHGYTPGYPPAEPGFGPGHYGGHRPQPGFAPERGGPMEQHGQGYGDDDWGDQTGYEQAAFGPGNTPPNDGLGHAHGGGARPNGPGYGPYRPGYGNAYAQGGARPHADAYEPNSSGPGYVGSGYGAGNFSPGDLNRDLFRNLTSLLPAQHTDQFLMGLLIGAGAAFILGDEEIRGKLMKTAVKAYAGLAGGFEELKEQMADIRAEVEAERHGDE